MINEVYPNIEWITNKHGDIKKENYDACDSLVCTLAYININRYGLEKPIISNYTITTDDESEETVVKYDVEIWGKTFHKQLILKK